MTDQLLLNFDLAGAEWVVAAFLARDPAMIDVIRSGKSPHTVTGARMSGFSEELVKRESDIVKDMTNEDTVAELRRTCIPEVLEPGHLIPRSMSIRQMSKKMNFGLNYDEGYKMFALMNEIEESESRRIVNAYHRVYPGIQRTFHADVQDRLRKDRTLTNCYGRQCYFMGMMGRELFKQGYAFIPSSTVADTANQAIILSMEDDARFMEPLHLLSQVHDSAVFQYPAGRWDDLAQACIRIGLDHMATELEYGERFRLSCDLKIGLNWGTMQGVKLTRDIDALALSLHDTWESLQVKKAA